MPRLARQDAARARAHPPPHPVRQVRRPALPRGRPREGPDRPAPAGRQPGRRDRLVPPSAAARGCRAGDERGGCSTLLVTEGGGRAGTSAGRPPAQQLPADARAPADAADRGARRHGATSRRAGPRAERAARRARAADQARYPDGPLRLADLDQLVAAARESSPTSPFRRRAGARPAAFERGSRGPSAPRRGLPRALDDPLGKGTRVGRRPRAGALRRQLPGLHVRGIAGGDRRGAPPALRGDDPGPPRSCTSTCRCATTTARTGATTPTATASRRGFSPRRSRTCVNSPVRWSRWRSPIRASRPRAGSGSRSTRCSNEAAAAGRGGRKARVGDHPGRSYAGASRSVSANSIQ